jgi:hypothetical protein
MVNKLLIERLKRLWVEMHEEDNALKSKMDAIIDVDVKDRQAIKEHLKKTPEQHAKSINKLSIERVEIINAHQELGNIIWQLERTL